MGLTPVKLFVGHNTRFPFLSNTKSGPAVGLLALELVVKTEPAKTNPSGTMAKALVNPIGEVP